MIQLHVLAFEGGQLLLAAHPEAASAGYSVAVDEQVLALLGPGGANTVGVVSDAAVAEPEPEPEAEPEPEFVLPEGPLEVSSPSEALDAAHGLWLVRDENEVSQLQLHDAVLANLEKWNVRIATEILDEGWWVTKLGDRAWQISFRFLSRGRIHEAEWVLDTEDARLTPENHFAEVLAWWKPEAAKRSRRRRRSRSRGRGGQGGGGGHGGGGGGGGQRSGQRGGQRRG